MFVKLSIDFENPARVWWKSGGIELWEGITGDADANSVVIEESLANSWITEAEKLPGWFDGPDYAPNPVNRGDVDPDEDF